MHTPIIFLSCPLPTTEATPATTAAYTHLLDLCEEENTAGSSCTDRVAAAVSATVAKALLAVT